MNDIEIGLGKRGRAALSFDDIAIAPSRRTRAACMATWRISGFASNTRSSAGVTIGPGMMPFTLTFGPRSAAISLVMWVSAILAT